jgi:hypothetical protein
MRCYTLSRTGQASLVFHGEQLACVYGLWHYGIYWSRYHNLAVYRTEDGSYVVSIQYRMLGGDYKLEEPCRDLAVMVPGDPETLAEAFARYNPLERLLRPGHQYEDYNFLRRRYHEQAKALLAMVRMVEEGRASPPMIQPVMIDYSRIDPEIQEAFELQGIEQGISGMEWLRRSTESEMSEVGEGGAPVIVYEPEEAVVAEEAEEEDEEKSGPDCPL